MTEQYIYKGVGKKDLLVLQEIRYDSFRQLNNFLRLQDKVNGASSRARCLPHYLMRTLRVT